MYIYEYTYMYIYNIIHVCAYIPPSLGQNTTKICVKTLFGVDAGIFFSCFFHPKFRPNFDRLKNYFFVTCWRCWAHIWLILGYSGPIWGHFWGPRGPFFWSLCLKVQNLTKYIYFRKGPDLQKLLENRSKTEKNARRPQKTQKSDYRWRLFRSGAVFS